MPNIFYAADTLTNQSTMDLHNKLRSEKQLYTTVVTNVKEYAEKHGIFIIGLGDFKQTASKNEGTIKGEVQMVSNGIEDFVSLRTPSPTASLRASNVAKLDNYNVVNSILESVEREYSFKTKQNILDFRRNRSFYLSP